MKILKEKEIRKDILKEIRENLFRECPPYQTIIEATILFFTIFVLDYLNIPSLYFAKLPRRVVFVAAVCAMICIVSVLLKHKLFSLWKVKTVTFLDKFIIVSGVVSLIYGISSPFLIHHVRTCALLYGGLMIFIGFLRVFQQYNALKTGTSTNLVDLIDLYNNSFSDTTKASIEQGTPIFVAEKSASYDLLHRSNVIDHLYHSIVYCQPDESFVISLEGPWGSGKTTIINNVKNRLMSSAPNYTIIDENDFDPWVFGNQEALLSGLLEVLLRRANIKYKPSQSKKLFNNIMEIVSSTTDKGKVLKSIYDSTISNESAISELKHRLSSYLKTSNTRFVFFIDNLDRATDSNIVFLLKVIGTILHLPGLVYVLSFERERIDNVLKETHEFDSRFTEKIIQEEIKVPEINQEVNLSFCKVCMKNLLRLYKIDEKDFKQFDEVFAYISLRSSNLREFKRMINSIFPIVFCQETQLNKSDLLSIEAIRFFDFPVYIQIYRHPQFFLRHERTKFQLRYFNPDFSVEKNAGTFFDSVFSNTNKDVKRLLAYIFPAVAQYTEHRSRLKEDEIRTQNRISSGKYFYLYFSYDSNDYVRINNRIQSMLRDNIYTLDFSEMAACEKREQAIWIGQLALYLNMLSKQEYPIFLQNLSKEFCNIDSSNRESLISVIFDLLLKCSQSQVSEYLDFFDGNYKIMSVLFRFTENFEKQDISYYGDSQKEADREYSRICSVQDMISEKKTRIFEEIISEKIELYNRKFYFPNNIWYLFYVCSAYHQIHESNNQMYDFKRYIDATTSKKYVYKILFDCISCVSSDDDCYRYRMERTQIQDMGLSEFTVFKWLEENPPSNYTEEKIKDIYGQSSQPIYLEYPLDYHDL